MLFSLKNKRYLSFSLKGQIDAASFSNGNKLLPLVLTVHYLVTRNNYKQILEKLLSFFKFLLLLNLDSRLFHTSFAKKKIMTKFPVLEFSSKMLILVPNTQHENYFIHLIS